MNNIIVTYPNNENFKFYNENNIDGFIIGIEGFSENFNYYLKESSLKNTIKKIISNNQKAYIALNKVIFNEQIPELVKLLKKLNTLEIEAVIFSDIAIFNIVKEYNLDINLIWNSKMTTNSKSINFFEKRGLYGFIPTSQITLDEYIDITKSARVW